MARCNETYFNKVNKSKYDSSTEVTINILSDLPECKRINAKNYVTAQSGVTFYKFSKPQNHFECFKQGCVNTGTLDGVGTDGVVYRIPYDATEYAAGVIAFYVKPSEVAAGKITVTIASDSAMKNADVYTVSVDFSMVREDGYIPITIDLVGVPTSEAGTGWEASTAGAYIKIASDTLTFGVSSIAVFDSIEDFDINDVVKISCVSEITNDIQADIAEETCVTNGYDQESAPTVDYSITGKKLTPNFWKLNPMAGKGATVDGFTINTIKKVVEKSTDGKYGVIAIPDALQTECGFIGVQVNDTCNTTESALTRLSAWSENMGDGYFYVAPDATDDVTYIRVHKGLIGQEVNVSYPQRAEVEERVTAFGNLGKKRARISFPYKTSDGIEYNVVYNNCLVTSFPMGITSGENEVTVSFSVQMDSEGAYFHEYRIVK